MGFSCGVVGLPNVGKSTLFNALSKKIKAEAANYPFCTIEPNMAQVSVPDKRLSALAQLANSERIIPTTLQFFDIAGLVKGAHKGEGLGNKFLSHIRSVDAILHVLRCFDDPNITHVDGHINPRRDKDVIETELMLADMQQLENIAEKLHKKSRTDKELAQHLVYVQKALSNLEAGIPLRQQSLSQEEVSILSEYNPLTLKPVLYIGNIDDTNTPHIATIKDLAKEDKAPCVFLSSKMEQDIALLPEEEQGEFYELAGINTSGLDAVISEGYKLLNLLTFFTVGPKEARAWTIECGTKAPQAAGKIHSDMERGFIAAEVISLEDYIACKGESGAKDAGKYRLEGKDYSIQEGDICLFRFNV